MQLDRATPGRVRASSCFETVRTFKSPRPSSLSQTSEHRYSSSVSRPRSAITAGSFIDGERDGALKAVGSRDEQTESSLERVGSNPSFVWQADVFPTRDDGCLDSLSAMPRDTSNVENGDRHTASL